MRRDLFIGAQALVYEAATKELKAGLKEGHWMWCVFPQMALGTSYEARLFALTETDAAEYVADPVLGPRLEHCMGLVLRIDNPLRTFDFVDFQKLQSSVTLFDYVGSPAAHAVLSGHFHVRGRCKRTVELIESGRSGI